MDKLMKYLRKLEELGESGDSNKKRLYTQKIEYYYDLVGGGGVVPITRDKIIDNIQTNDLTSLLSNQDKIQLKPLIINYLTQRIPNDIGQLFNKIFNSSHKNININKDLIILFGHIQKYSNLNIPEVFEGIKKIKSLILILNDYLTRIHKTQTQARNKINEILNVTNFILIKEKIINNNKLTAEEVNISKNLSENYKKIIIHLIGQKNNTRVKKTLPNMNIYSTMVRELPSLDDFNKLINEYQQYANSNISTA